MQDFMAAVRASSVNRLHDIKNRQLRLKGRPPTSAEAAAPYQAMADTATSRLATGKTLQLQEEAQGTQKEQFGERLEFDREQSAQQATLERERMAELQRQHDQNLKLQKRQMEAQLSAAEMARQDATSAQKAQLLTTGAGLAAMVFEDQLKSWGGSIAKGIGGALKKIGGK
jgi:hypothetical protein